MVFGKKNRFRSGGGHKAPKLPCDSASYRRPKPAEDEVTSEEHYPITICHHCGGPLTDKEECVRYIEDIILAALDNITKLKNRLLNGATVYLVVNTLVLRI